MTDVQTLDAHGELIAPATLMIRRTLPGPIERIWAYVTEGDLRRTWLAAGEMDLTPGATFELVWRNDELTDPPGEKPEGFGGEHRATCRIVEVDPPRKLVFDWTGVGQVEIRLAPKGEEVLLTLTHSRIPDRKTELGVSAGWHAHLDVLAARARGETPAPFWDAWRTLRADYEARLAE